MLKRRAVHKDMAEANVYAARRLKDMAQSLGGLAKTFGRCREEPGLSRGRHRGPGGGVGHGMRSVRLLRDPEGMQAGRG